MYYHLVKNSFYRFNLVIAIFQKFPVEYASSWRIIHILSVPVYSMNSYSLSSLILTLSTVWIDGVVWAMRLKIIVYFNALNLVMCSWYPLLFFKMLVLRLNFSYICINSEEITVNKVISFFTQIHHNHSWPNFPKRNFLRGVCPQIPYRYTSCIYQLSLILAIYVNVSVSIPL